MTEAAEIQTASFTAQRERYARDGFCTSDRPLLDADGEALEADVYRMSAASCYEKAGDLSRAANLYQAALAGPLRAVTREEVEGMLAACLTRHKAQSV